MDFPSIQLQESLTIQTLYSFHYFEYAKGFVFDGEQHDFWEILYVDKGEVEVRADDQIHTLHQGNMIFHKPEEFHTVSVKHEHTPPNLIVICFECTSPAMTIFETKILSLGDRERNILSLIIQEGFQAFLPPFDKPTVHHLERNPHAPFASEQMIKSYLELLLITLIRNQAQASTQDSMKNKQSSLQKEKAEQRIVQQIMDYLKANLSQSFTQDHLCQTFHLGKSRLKELFQSQMQTGVLEAFKSLKIEQAKTYIRDGRYNFTEIAAMLGYASIHYFSRDFKKTVGMPPSDYARSVKARL
ncbi:AraC family transcriptional regulator [Paenibacillus alginolyticus]|uniref:AraC family transcriptional regulator n=1 Tax=Paenibacillus alginolyticus TaxID=59839 RepID=A0ABT4GEW3_9BACL|nr:AraC family transcriptional regulator [Paenibacillus alginolyticus]MCY9694727.1 AraC family transcriptional regulator [Paenibacillus alginolyticus]MEC0147102.1 AraC family transcriptional regulator [Paenibacillus alginolyticus]